VLKRTFRPKRNETIGSWRKFHNRNLHNLYSSPNIIRMIRQKKQRWGHVAGMGEKMGFVGKPQGKKTQENLDVDVRIINKVDSTGI
jgi:hypothetical protein